MYNGGGSRVYLRTAASSAETGTVAYAVQHPLTFITGVSGSENDWLWSAHSDDLWSASKKSAYDPCPYGWRVAPSAVFDGLKLVGAPTAADADKYGWGLTDPERGTSSLFIGAGRHRYDNSTILNVYNPVTVRSGREAQPWEAFGPQGRCRVQKSPAFHFWFEKKATGGRPRKQRPHCQHVGALREGAIGTSGRNRTTDRHQGRSVFVWYNSCGIAVLKSPAMKIIKTGKGSVTLVVLLAIWSVSAIASLPGLAVSPLFWAI